MLNSIFEQPQVVSVSSINTTKILQQMSENYLKSINEESSMEEKKNISIKETEKNINFDDI